MRPDLAALLPRRAERPAGALGMAAAAGHLILGVERRTLHFEVIATDAVPPREQFAAVHFLLEEFELFCGKG